MKVSPLTVLIFLFVAQFALYEYMLVAPERSSPPDKVYNRVSGYDSVYVSWMRQAALGSWVVRDQRTTAPIPGVFIYPLFILLGKVSGLLHVDVEQVYLLSKVVGGILVFISVYMLVKEFFPRMYRGAALMFILAVEMGPWWGKEASIFGLGIVLRHFGVAHHTIGEAAALIFFILYYRNIYTRRVDRTIWMMLLGIFATSILLPFMVQLWITLAVVFGGIALYRRIIKSYLITTVLAGASIGLPALLYKYEFSLGPPWDHSAAAERMFYTTQDVVIRYFGSLFYYVPFFVLACIFLPTLWRRLSRPMQDITTLSVVGVCMPILLLAILPMVSLPIANFRFIDAYVPVYPGIIAVVGLIGLWRSLGSAFDWRKIGTVALTFAIFATSVYATGKFTNETVGARRLEWDNIFIPISAWHAVQFFNTVPVNSGVLALEHFGDVIADHAPVRVFVGMNPVYADFWQRESQARVFYAGTLPSTDAYEFLRSHDISYVFYGPIEEQVAGVQALYPDVLTPVYQSQGTTVYKVNESVR